MKYVIKWNGELIPVSKVLVGSTSFLIVRYEFPIKVGNRFQEAIEIVREDKA